MNSFHDSVNAKSAAHTSPGTAMGRMMRHSAWIRVAPSTIAHSSISLGTVRKYPMRSHVQNGTRNVGYVTTRAHLESPRPSQFTTWASGRNRSEVGTRYVTKIPVPMPSETVVASTVTSRLFLVHVRNSVSQSSLA